MHLQSHDSVIISPGRGTPINPNTKVNHQKKEEIVMSSQLFDLRKGDLTFESSCYLKKMNF